MKQGSVINPEFIEHFLHGNAEKVRKYVVLYLESVEPKIELIVNADREQNYELLRSNIHKLRSSFMMMGMRETSEFAAELDELIFNGNATEKIPELTKLIVDDIADSIEECRYYLEKGMFQE